jgi:hypothetical protein
MDDWLANDVQLGWLTDPFHQQAFVYNPGGLPVTVGGDFLPGGGPVEGPVLDLAKVWRCYG